MRYAPKSVRGIPLVVLFVVSMAMVSQASTLSYYIDIFGSVSNIAAPGAPTLAGTYPNQYPVPLPAQVPSAAYPAGTRTVYVPQLVTAIPGDPNHFNKLNSVTFLLYMDATADAHVVNTDPLAAHGFTNLTAQTTMTVSEIGGLVSLTQAATTAVNSSTPCVASTDGKATLFACNPTPLNVDKQRTTSVTTYSYGTGPAYVANCAIFGGTIVTAANQATYDPSGTHLGACAYNETTTVSHDPITNYYDGLTSTSNNTASPAVLTSGLGAFESLGGTTSVGFTVSINETTVTGSELSGTNYLSWGGNGRAGGVLEVIYDYDVVAPEPTTLLLIGSSLFALGVVLRRRVKV